MCNRFWRAWLVGASVILVVATCNADEPAATLSKAPAASEGLLVDDTNSIDRAQSVEQEGIRRLTKDHDLWIDLERKLVIVDGQVCLREGQLEMFACPQGTKEHESIISLNCRAQFIHAALVAVGAKSGQPVQFDPEYKPASGSVIDIYLLWTDEAGSKHKARAQQWVKQLKTGKEMPFDWVFAGSGFWTDEQSGQRHYMADGGDLICVSNFPSATLDLPVASSQANEGLLFSAFTERIPPLKTKVRMVLRPRLPNGTPAKGGASGDQPSAP